LKTPFGGKGPRIESSTSGEGIGSAPRTLAGVRAATSPTAPALQGTLRDLPVADVVRLLAANGSSGTLTVHAPAPLRLVLAGGAVLVGSAGSAMALGRYALAAGLVTAERMEDLFGLVRNRLGEQQARSFDEVDVLDTLLGEIPDEQLAAAATAQSVAALFEMLLLTEAEWRFVDGDPGPAARLGATAASVLDAAAAQAGAWPALTASVGGDATHLRRVRRLVGDRSPVLIDAVEWAALSEIDDRSTIGQIAHRLGLGRHDAAAMIAALIERGLAEPA